MVVERLLLGSWKNEPAISMKGFGSIVGPLGSSERRSWIAKIQRLGHPKP